MAHPPIQHPLFHLIEPELFYLDKMKQYENNLLRDNVNYINP